MAYVNCKWCCGEGCLACEAEREKDMKRFGQPIFTADRNNSSDMKLLKDVFGHEAIEEAFGPGGGGLQEIERNAAIASFIQHVRQANQSLEPTP
jgi:hypothetical protein